MKNDFDIYNKAYKMSEYFENNLSMCILCDKKYIRDRFENEVYLLLKNIYRAYFNKKRTYDILVECLVSIALLDSLISSMRGSIKDKNVNKKINNLSYLLGSIKDSIYGWKNKYEVNEL